MFEYYFFDLDGTLTDPGIGITNSVMYALKRFGIEVSDRSELYKFIGPPLIDSFENFYGFTKEQAFEALGYYREYFSTDGLFENTVYPDVEASLTVLKNAGAKLVVATSKPEEFSNRILKHFGLDKYFDFVAGATMDEKRSTKAAVIEHALTSLGITNPDNVLMIGDRSHDCIGAGEHGIACAGVLYGYGTITELTEAGAKYIVETPANLASLVLLP